MPSPRPPQYEPAEPEDLPAAWQVFLAGSDPGARHGSRRPDPDQPGMPPPLYPHLLATSDGAFWVARVDDRVVGFAAAISRGDTWFLSELWVVPEHRGRGIGSRLFRFARRTIRGARGKVRAAMAGDDGGGLVIGMRDGMLARHPIFRLEGDREAAGRAWKTVAGGAGARLVRYDPAAAIEARSPLLQLDRDARGGARPQDHAFWLAEPGRDGFLVWVGKRAVAYFYVTDRGEIGPLAASGPKGLQLAIRHAVKEAARRAERVALRVPAVNRAALEPLIAAGFRLVGGGVLLSSGAIGHPEEDLPADDSLF